MVEETVFVEVEGSVLPCGKDWTWLGDLNVLAIRRGLSIDDKAAVLNDVSRWWRGAHLRLVQSS